MLGSTAMASDCCPVIFLFSSKRDYFARIFFFAENEGESGGTALKTRKNRILCIQF
jgi:hypothetical protein